MKAFLYTVFLAGALVSVHAQAKPDKGKHGHKNGHHKHQQHNYKSSKKLSKKQQKKLVRAGWTPPGLSKRYHRGDYLDRNVYKQGRVIERSRDNGTVSIKIDSTVIHMVHDTREILSILTR
ncbi:hypothetical protein CWB60_19205 [Pseudoalteromonas sp. S327]|uniref:hypothetical protein n=1 Tax=unclassified Pseudoalteromonas TaxID=194690 RepID=UPI00110BBBF0|nr:MULTISPECIES: hypothetical protein [unclassified Pseudoalteromonas]TMO03440.1 hypothetical protein CWB60_19205 [Pseudoalteromonas sp. S327]TMO19198.1 hypothetical protein CWB59_06390 [Pseudoalteromonas sp. S326]